MQTYAIDYRQYDKVFSVDVRARGLTQALREFSKTMPQSSIIRVSVYEGNRLRQVWPSREETKNDNT